ncbi:hypothetical protein DX910_13610 [Acinetobacter haemolyticus]|nr:hypothetical protein DX910_13555 [Acinetobacter haemolyticus]AZN69128.1 hypothetical protein DX910_13610 [Acinetobacter haemolyticus]
MSKSRLVKAYEKIYEVFNKTTPSGMLSVTKSRNLRIFLLFAVNEGLENIKDRYSERKFKSNLKDLLKCGIDKEFIEEEYQKHKFKNKKKNYEFIEIKFDFNNQVPKDYVEPKSKFTLEELLEKNGKSHFRE